jgi:hypothetical protein
MRRPSAPGSPIDANRYRRWVSRFGSYRDGIINITIASWLEQFEERDRDLAARILDVVEFYGQTQILSAFRQTLQSLPGWNISPTERLGNWRFAAMSSSAGESGDSMLYQFRIANGLDSRRFNDLFVTRSELFRQPMLPENDPRRLGQDDVVVLLDDFSGTGTQVCDAWNDPETSFGALLAGVGKVYLILVAASRSARQRIVAETTMLPIPAHELREADSVFAEECNHFSQADRARLLHYCRLADNRNPMGFGGCGLVVVFQHRPPNNSIPILHADHPRWTGLFRRHD